MGDHPSGEPASPSGQARDRAMTSCYVVYSLILGILGFCTFGVTGIPGVVLGVIGLRQIVRSGGRLRGRPEAVGAILVSGMSLVLWAVFLWADRERGRYQGTQMLLEGIRGALQRYHEDWAKYPWSETTSDGVMGAVAAEYRPAPDSPHDAEAVLYAALNMRRRNGPYMPPDVAMAVTREAPGRRWFLYADGWGRPIRYTPPVPGTDFPLLESEGPDPDDSADNVLKY